MDEQLQKAKRVVMENPGDSEAWEKYRIEFGRAGKTPVEWLDEVVACSYMPIKEKLLEAGALLTEFPKTKYWAHDEDLEVLAEYVGLAKRGIGLRLESRRWWMGEKPVLILKPDGLFSYAEKETSHDESVNGEIF